MLSYRDDATTGEKVIALILGPIIGLAYVVFLPFVSVAALIFMIGKKLFGAIWSLLKSLVYFEWRPSEAYLAGKKKKKEKTKDE
jgi:hypothetical protein